MRWRQAKSMNARTGDAVSAAPLRVKGDGWLADVRCAPSPHADERPPGANPELVVIHGISLPPGEFGGPWVEDFFVGRLDISQHSYFAEIGALRVAPHVFVRRNGEIVQFVSCLRRAWHAGRSQWQDRGECNDFSIGVELEGADDIPYTDMQYATLAGLIPALRSAYPGIGDAAVVGHSDIAPGRKTDPGPAFDWSRLAELLAREGYNLERSPPPEREGFRA